MIGGYFDRFHAGWGETEVAWFESLVEEDDVKVIAWALGTLPVPERFAGAQMTAMQRLDYVSLSG